MHSFFLLTECKQGKCLPCFLAYCFWTIELAGNWGWWGGPVLHSTQLLSSAERDGSPHISWGRQKGLSKHSFEKDAVCCLACTSFASLWDSLTRAAENVRWKHPMWGLCFRTCWYLSVCSCPDSWGGPVYSYQGSEKGSHQESRSVLLCFGGEKDLRILLQWTNFFINQEYAVSLCCCIK